MALKELVSDLSNFKYGMSSPDKVDSQIETGVDFFDNNEGGADGFTPKADLESLYHKVRDGNVVAGPIPPGNSPQFQSPFMTTPIADAVSMFNEDPFSVTLGTKAEPLRGDKKFNDRTYYITNQPAGTSFNFPSVPDAHIIGEDWGYNLPVQRSSAGNTQIPIINDKRRGVFDHIVSTTFEHQPFPVNQQPDTVFDPTYDRYFSEMSGKSIHISPSGELKAGLRYNGLFGGQNNGMPITDTLSEIHSTDVILGDRYSVYSNYPNVLETPSNLIVGDEVLLAKWPERPTTNLLTATPYKESYERFVLHGMHKDSTIIDELQERVEGFNNSIDKLYEFKDGQFTKVPSGIGDDRLFGTKLYREVANSGPFEGKDNHPLILRDIGNKWGTDDIVADSPFDSALGGIVPGAPTFTGYIDRVLNDRVRVGKFLLTAEGISFVAKQFAFQALNPTIETKLWNPLSALSIVGANDLIAAFQGDLSGGGVAALGRSIASLFFQIGHPERHLGNTRYEKVMEIGGSRIQWSADAFAQGAQAPAIPRVSTDLPFGIGEALNAELENIQNAADSAVVVPFFTLSNPNKYTFPISSAPKSVVNGVPSFIGAQMGADLALTDVQTAMEKPGGTFNESSQFGPDNNSAGFNNEVLTIPYSGIPKGNVKDNLEYYEKGGHTDQDVNKTTTGTWFDRTVKEFEKSKKLVQHLGQTYGGRVPNPNNVNSEVGDFQFKRDDPKVLGPNTVLGNEKSDNVDKLNITPIIDSAADEYPEHLLNHPDFIKFNFFNVVEKKYIVFRAILEGIADSINPEYNATRYLGRPDNVYTYVGTDRTISFNFKLYPKTKQELPVLMEKMNYLVGLCYPSYTEQERMITPFIELTMGDMFNRTPGLLNSVGITVEDAGTWEIQEGLQYPHYISVACEFQHIGKYVPHNVGKHYDLSWLDDYRVDGNRQPLGTFDVNSKIPTRTGFKYIDNIGNIGNSAENNTETAEATT